MQNVDTVIKQVIDGSVESISSTGTTINYGTTIQHYVKTTVYQKKYRLTDKTLKRFREQLESKNKLKDHRLYFVYMDGKYWYTAKMLELRKYNKDRNITDVKPVRKQIVNGNETHRSGIINWIKSKRWDYKCGASYSNSVSFDRCARKMEKLFRSLTTVYPDATVTIFYVTEENAGKDGHHNHFLISITGPGKNKKQTIQSKIKSIGGDIAEVEKYDPTDGEDFIRYVTKQLERNPECYYYLTNDNQS